MKEPKCFSTWVVFQSSIPPLSLDSSLNVFNFANLPTLGQIFLSKWIGSPYAILAQEFREGFVSIPALRLGADTIPHPQVVLGEMVGSDDPTTRSEYDWDGPIRVQIKIHVH